MAKKRKTTSAKNGPQWSEVILRWWGSELSGKLRRVLLIAMLVGGVLGGLGWGLRSLERYVLRVGHERQVSLTVSMKHSPEWADASLVEEICLSTGIRSDDQLLDEQLTAVWASNLAQNPWVKRVNQVRKMYTGQVVLDCELRQPIAMVVGAGDSKYYIDAEGVVLPNAVVNSHVVRIEGVRGLLPVPGQTANSADVSAGLEVLTKILQMDQQLPAKDRVWRELAVINVSNYEGRVSQGDPHLVLYTPQATEIWWGAAIGRSVPHYEADVKMKLATLYRKHKKYGRFDDQKAPVELRNWRDDVSDPVKQNG